MGQPEAADSFICDTEMKRCLQCGKCCDFPLVNSSRLMYERNKKLCFKRPIINEDIEFIKKNWIFVERKNNRLVFECKMFDKNTRRCLIYDFRTGLCRDYPYEDKCANEG